MLIFGALSIGCGGGGDHHHDDSSTSSFAGTYSGTYAERTPALGSVTGTATLIIASDGTITGTTTDSRYSDSGTIASGSQIGSDGTVTLISNFSSSNSTEGVGTLTLDASGNLTGTLTESNGMVSGPTFAYTLTRTATN